MKRLGNELQEAQERRADAEARCDLLERQLEVVERPLPLPLPQPQLMPKVLVVDDQPDNLLATTAVLGTLDQELVTVSSGREALKPTEPPARTGALFEGRGRHCSARKESPFNG